MAANKLHIEMFFDDDSSTFSYVVADGNTGVAAIIDPVLNYDAAAGTVSTADADKLLAYLAANGLTLKMNGSVVDWPASPSTAPRGSCW